MAEDPSVNVEGATQGTETPPETPPPPQQVEKPSLQSLLSEASDDDWKEVAKHPRMEKLINDRGQSIGSKRFQDYQKQYTEQQRQAQADYAFAQQMTQLQRTQPALAQMMLADNYNRLRYERGRSGETITQLSTVYAENILKNLRERLGKESAFEDVDFDEFEQTHGHDLADYILALRDHVTDKERKQMMKEVDEKLQAFKNQIEAQQLKKGSEPEDVPEGEKGKNSDAWKELEPTDKIALALKEERDRR